MERRNWLWKRKSSEKSPGETESSESISSLSERNYDDQEVQKTSPNPDIQSPEVTSKVESNGEEIHDKLKNLTQKLAAALANVSIKDDLVKQHSKVAEEAVSGWEKAENEAVVLKQQLEASVKNNAALEDRVSHLDGALKECVRQLRQAREEQQQKIQEAVKKKSQEWEATKSELENKYLELQERTSKTESSATADPELCSKRDFLEKENLSLKHELASKGKLETHLIELQVKERENSALKLELFSLFEELEYRNIERDLSTQAAETASKQRLESIKKVAKLEAECRRLKSMLHKPSFNHKRSVADSQSDGGDQFNESMSEFDQLENKKSGRNITFSKIEIDLMDDFLEMEQLAALPQTMTKTSCLATQVTDNRSVTEVCALRTELDAMHTHTAEIEEKLWKMETKQVQVEKKLEILEAEKAELEAKLEIMEAEKYDFKEKLEQMEAEKYDFKEKFLKIEAENYDFQEKLEQMEAEKYDFIEKLEKMEAEKYDFEEKLEQMGAEKDELVEHIEKMEAEKNELEEKLDQMKAEKDRCEEKIHQLETENAELVKNLTESQHSLKLSQVQLEEYEMKLSKIQNELQTTNEKKCSFETQLVAIESESQTLRVKINSLRAEVEKERIFSAEIAIKNRELEDEISRKKKEEETASSNRELKIKQADLAVAAEKFAECQQTIESLGKQLKSLASLEDFLIDTTNLTDFSETNKEVWRSRSKDSFLVKRNSDFLNVAGDACSEKNRNSFVKMFSRNKNAVQLENNK